MKEEPRKCSDCGVILTDTLIWCHRCFEIRMEEDDVARQSEASEQESEKWRKEPEP